MPHALPSQIPGIPPHPAGAPPLLPTSSSAASLLALSHAAFGAPQPPHPLNANLVQAAAKEEFRNSESNCNYILSYQVALPGDS